MLHRTMAVALAVAMGTSGVAPLANQPAIGKKLDNYLNHNLPFATVEYSCEADGSDYDFDEYGRWVRVRDWHVNCYNSIGFEFYDEMDAEEKVATDANHQLENVLGAAGSWLTSAVIGVVGAKLGAKVAPAVATSTTGQVTSGVFGSAIEGATGMGQAAGSW